MWRSDDYGRAGTWKDVTLQMEGAAQYPSPTMISMYFHEEMLSLKQQAAAGHASATSLRPL